MNYNEMTDLEINKAVALALGCHIRKSAFGTDYYFTDDYKAWDKCAPHGPVENFDPCNSWADAGPIIEREKINIEYRYDCNGFWLAGFGSGKGSHAFLQKKPLRAAMIVFLMMQEEK